MKGSLVILAALCVIVAAEASSVRFVSVDDAQNGKDRKNRSEVSDGTDPGLKKSVEDVVKKINDGDAGSEKMVKSLDVERSSADGKSADGLGDVKKSESAEKPRVHKRDVRRALQMMAKRAMKRASTNEGDWGNIFTTRSLIVKYLTLQKSVIGKITSSLVFAVERLEKDPKEKETLITNLKDFLRDVQEVYDKAIGSLLPKSDIITSKRNYMRADELPALMTTLNQRNPLAIIPLVTRLVNAVTGAASVVDMAASLVGARSNVQDLSPLLETMERTLSTAGLYPTQGFDLDEVDM